MAVRRIRAEGQASSQPLRARPVLAGQSARSARSPALELQAQLSADLDARGRWPPLATLAFVVGTCGGFWTAVAWGVSRLAQ
jgi:hypothetical protein